jgi:hypothetical protein
LPKGKGGKMKTYTLLLVSILLLTTISIASAEVDGIYDVYCDKNGNCEKVSWYNHDRSIFQGSEYQEKRLELLMGGYSYKGFEICEYSGGAGQQFGSYEEDYFVKTKLNMIPTDDEKTWFYGIFGLRSTAEGIQYYDDETNQWINVPSEMELEIQVEDLELRGIFDHDAKTFVWFNVGDAEITALPVINPDGTEAQWTFDDYWVDGINIIHAQIIVDGEEEWATRTVTIELPPTPAGAPQLQPLNYGNNLIGKYGFQTIEDAIEWVESLGLTDYIKVTDDGVFTYENSPVDLRYKSDIYTPKHKASFVD